MRWIHGIVRAGLVAAPCLCGAAEVWPQLWFMIKKKVFGDLNHIAT